MSAGPTLPVMDQIDDLTLDTFAPAAVGAIADAEVLPEDPAEVADRSMLVVQYGLALIAAVAAILLTQAS